MNNITETTLQHLYGNHPDILDRQKKRVDTLYKSFQARYGMNNALVLSTPGRSEISGNHTDHNNGKVIAAGINLDTLGIAASNNSNKLILYSQEFKREYEVDVNDLDIVEDEKESTTALMRGILKGLKERGYATGGCTMYVQSDVQVGSGLSSSASIEMFIGSVLNELYNGGKIEPLEIARTGQYAENKYFGKPSGLMDQIACAYGGVVVIDFGDPENPIIRRIDLDLNTFGYALLIVDTEGNHADLTSEYASVPAELRMVAEAFEKTYCREINEEEFYSRIPELRRSIGERPVLRAMHFFEENKRVDEQIKLLEQEKFHDFLSLVNESGSSSMKFLQNIYPSNNPQQQPITLGIALTERFIKQMGGGAVRIHGGGFAGTYQVFLPVDAVKSYKELIEPVFGKGNVKTLAIRNCGSVIIKRD